MRMIRSSAFLALLAAPALAQQPIPAAQPGPPVVTPAPVFPPRVPVVVENPNKQIYGVWEMHQYFRPDPSANPIPKGTVEFKEDHTFIWLSAHGDKLEGKYQIYNDKIMLSTTTAFGKVRNYNFTDLDIVDGKILRPIGLTAFEVWQHPVKKEEKPEEKSKK